MSVEITCRDTETGETETMTIEHRQYLVVCGMHRYVSGEQVHGNGTAVVTIRSFKSADDAGPATRGDSK